MPRLPGFVGPSYTLSTVTLDCQRTINLYPEVDELQTGKDNSIGALVCRPDLTRVCLLPQSPVRGMWRCPATGEVFAVGGNGLYQIFSDWSTKYMGRLKTESGAVSMSDNGQQLIVVDGEFGYIIQLDNKYFQQITSPNFYSSSKVIFLDGYFLLARPDTGQVYRSELYDGLTYQPLNFATAEASPDNVVTLMPYRNQLFIFGSRTTEPYYDSGDAGLAFARVQGALIEHGCAASLSPAKDGELLYWLGENEYGNGIVLRTVGYQATRASNYGVELAIQGYGTISDAVGFIFQMRGHAFYVLNFTGAGTTWVLDTAMGQWVEWQSVAKDGSQGRWRANCHVFAFGQHIVGDFEDGRIYTLGFSSRQDDGNYIMRRRRSPHVSTNLKRAIHSKFQLDFRAGVGTDGTSQGQDPQVMLRYSDDGGISWSSEKWRPLSRIGNTLGRAIWRMLGVSRNRVYEVTVTDPVDVAIVGADLDVTPCGS